MYLLKVFLEILNPRLSVSASSSLGVRTGSLNLFERASSVLTTQKYRYRATEPSPIFVQSLILDE